MRLALIACCVAKAIDTATVGEWPATVGFLACIPALWFWPTAGPLLLAAVVASLSFDDSHEFFLLSTALVVGLFPEPRQMALLLKVQVTVVWFVAGFSKLNPRYLGGSLFDHDRLWVLSASPTRVVLWGAIAAELVVLPVLLWTRPQLARWATVAFQLSVLIGMLGVVGRPWALVTFNLSIMAAVFAATEPAIGRRAAVGAPTGPTPGPVTGV